VWGAGRGKDGATLRVVVRFTAFDADVWHFPRPPPRGPRPPLRSRLSPNLHDERKREKRRSVVGQVLHFGRDFVDIGLGGQSPANQLQRQPPTVNITPRRHEL
jgi:hypothetical protein